MGSDFTQHIRLALRLLFGFALLVAGNGCRRSPTLENDGGVRLVYEIDRERMAKVGDEPDWSPRIENLPELRRALAARLDVFSGVTIEPVGEASLEIVVPGVAEVERDYIHALITRWGHLEFLIVANEHDHAEIVSQAFASGDDADVVIDGKKVARWVNLRVARDASTGEIYGFHGASANDIFRARRDSDAYERVDISSDVSPKADRETLNLARVFSIVRYRDAQVLVVVEPSGLNVTGRHLQKVTKTMDETLSPAITFKLSDEGGALMERLTSNNLPDSSLGLYRRLAIVMDDEMVTAPGLMSVVGTDGQITGQFFTDGDVDLLVRLLRSGRLPVLPKSEPASEEWFAPK